VSLNAATIEFLLAKGLSGEDLLEVARRSEARKDPTAAERMARHRARNATRNVTRNAPPYEDTSTPSVDVTEASASSTSTVSRNEPFPRPEWADPQAWKDFLANRKRKRMTNSVTAYEQFLGDVDRIADDEWPPGRLLKHAAGKGWGSINDPRENDHGRTNGNRQNGQRLGGPRPDPTLALVRAATAAQRQDAGDYGEARAALPPG
jgi:hypothetical protein